MKLLMIGLKMLKEKKLYGRIYVIADNKFKKRPSK